MSIDYINLFLDKAQTWRETFSEHRFSLHLRPQISLSSCVGSSMSLLQVALFMKTFNESKQWQAIFIFETSFFILNNRKIVLM